MCIPYRKPQFVPNLWFAVNIFYASNAQQLKIH